MPDLLNLTMEPTEIPDVLAIKTKQFFDDRGFFTETFNQVTWREQGFFETFVQDNLSSSRKATVRGMHYQLAASPMGKLVRVIHGAVFDVAIDIRRGSPTFGQWVGRTLSAENGLTFWVPAGFAHGFQALEDNTLVYYKCTSYRDASAERTLSYCDPQLAIPWPLPPQFVSKRDAEAPTLDQAEYDFHYKLLAE